MALWLWRGLLIVVLIFSICATPVMATSLTINAAFDDNTVFPGDEVFVRGTVKDPKDILVQNANVTVVLEKTNITVNTTTDDRGVFVASFVAPFELGNYSANVSAAWDSGASIFTGYSILFLEVLSPPPPAPDVCILGDDISFWSDAFVTDSKVLVNATVRNIGNLDANATVKIFLGTPFGGELLFSETMAIPAGGSNISSVMWPALSGTHMFTVVADQVAPSDSDFTNNQANDPLEIQDVYPPVISEPLISPKEPTSLDNITVLVSVEDDLGLAKENPVTLIYSVDNATEEDVPMTETKEGFLGTAGPFPGGTYVLFKVRALDLSANVAETEWYRLDIYYSSVTVNIKNATSKPGRELLLRCSLQYEDGSILSGQEALLVLDEINYTAVTNPLGVAVFNVTAPAKPGEYNFTVFINEKRLTANSSAVLTVIPVFPDLMIIQDGISFSWTNSSEVLVTIVLYNRGEATGEVCLETFLGTPSGYMMLNSSNFSVGTGEFYFHSFIWYPQPGHHTLMVRANCSGDNEPWNNLATAEVTIPAQELEVDAGGDEIASTWTMNHILLSLGLGILLSLMAIAFFTKFTFRGKSE